MNTDYHLDIIAMLSYISLRHTMNVGMMFSFFYHIPVALSSLKDKELISVNTVMYDNKTVRFITRQERGCQLLSACWCFESFMSVEHPEVTNFIVTDRL